MLLLRGGGSTYTILDFLALDIIDFRQNLRQYDVSISQSVFVRIEQIDCPSSLHYYFLCAGLAGKDIGFRDWVHFSFFSLERPLGIPCAGGGSILE